MGIKHIGIIKSGNGSKVRVGLQTSDYPLGHKGRKCFYLSPSREWREVRGTLVSNSIEAIETVKKKFS